MKATWRAFTASSIPHENFQKRIDAKSSGDQSFLCGLAVVFTLTVHRQNRPWRIAISEIAERSFTSVARDTCHFARYHVSLPVAERRKGQQPNGVAKANTRQSSFILKAASFAD
jgi:hypothetical protein